MKIVRKTTDDICFGDHILLPRKAYWHHGIYIGEGRVIHKTAGSSSLAAASFSKDASVFSCGGGISETDLNGFGVEEEDQQVFVCQYTACFAPEETVALAYSLVNAEGYRLWEANCEHFAIWCKTGEHISLQVRAIAFALSQIGAVTAGAMVGTATLARLQMGQVTHSNTSTTKGNLLGLGAKTVTTTVTQVHTPKVLAGAGLIGIASGVTYAVVRALQRTILQRRHLRFTVQVENASSRVNDAPTSTRRNPTVHKCGRFKNLKSLHEFIIKNTTEISSSNSNHVMHIQEILMFDPASLKYHPVEDVKKLPSFVSLRAVCSHKKRTNKVLLEHHSLPVGAPTLCSAEEPSAKVARA